MCFPFHASIFLSFLLLVVAFILSLIAPSDILHPPSLPSTWAATASGASQAETREEEGQGESHREAAPVLGGDSLAACHPPYPEEGGHEEGDSPYPSLVAKGRGGGSLEALV